MKFSISSSAFLTAVSLSSLTHAAPAPIVARDAPSWTVSNYWTGCSPGGCVYGFNLTNTPTNPTDGQFAEPAINTYCEGTDVRFELVDCNDATVSTNEVSGAANYTLIIQHKWQVELGGEDGGIGTFWIVGNKTIKVDGTPVPTTFTVPQLEEYAVA